LDTVGTEGGTVILGCSHAFCRTCLATHVARQQRHEVDPSCPLCKGVLSASEIARCGAAKPMEEESDDEGAERVMVIMEFEGEEGEEGFWVQFDAVRAKGAHARARAPSSQQRAPLLLPPCRVSVATALEAACVASEARVHGGERVAAGRRRARGVCGHGVRRARRSMRRARRARRARRRRARTTTQASSR
jgi:hypothetical protein